jgi:DNA adenine methylase
MPRSDMVQLDLFGDPIQERVVNVASVLHRSPFRYPGGKTWLVPRLRQWLRHLKWKPRVFVEPFAGGAIIGLTVAFEELAEKVVLIELDEDVATVWQTILSDDNEWLAQRVQAFHVTEASVRAELAEKPSSCRERAFKTLLKNRTFHGGILAAGSAPIRFGENGRGIGSRWYAETIAKRIREINQVRDRVQFVQGDGIEVIRRYSRRKRAAFFIDPPYTAGGKRAGNRLYTHHKLDHKMLFIAAGKLAGDFLMTYDLANELLEMAARQGFQARTIAMKNTHHAVMKELLIGRDLSWIPNGTSPVILD